MTKPYRPTASQVRLQAALANEALKAGSYLGLEKELQTVSGDAGAKPIDRRKLKRLATFDEDVALTFSELHVLDTFLRRKGHGGLSDIFRSSDLRQAISELPSATFFLGFQTATSTDARTWISHWDLCSVTELLHGLYRLHHIPQLKVKFEEVQLRQHPTIEQLNVESWYELVQNEQVNRTGTPSVVSQSNRTDENKQSLIAIGSPKACHASEVMLANMFGIEPFQSGGTEPRNDVPFQFEWSLEQIELTPSSFAFAHRTAKSLPTPFRQFSSFALHFRGHIYRVPMVEGQWKDFGVIVAQRRGNGDIWVVCAGLSGPATLASARMLATNPIELAPLPRSQPNSDPVVCIVEVDVTRDSMPSLGDRRKVLHEKFCGEPAVIRTHNITVGEPEPSVQPTIERTET